MKKKTMIASFILLLLIVPMALAATDSSSTSSTSSSSSSSSTDASSLVSVTSVVTDPEVFFPYEVGTITVTLTNSGTTPVGLSNPDILSDRIHIMNKDAWSTVSYISPGSTINYSFGIKADPPDGTTYALFSIGTKDGGSIHFPIIVKVDSTDVRAFISETPDAFSPSVHETVNLTIINPRAGGIKNIQITPAGTGIVVTPSTKYISALNGQSSADVSFSVTAEKESDLTFLVTYNNGDTPHTTNVVLPVIFGTDKSAAVPTVNNIALTSQGMSWDITGDVTNTGISDANGLVVTVGSPARGTGTYPEYAIGSLAADDSSSFEVTFTCNDLSSVPLEFNWKNDDGDDYRVTRILDLRSSAGASAAIAGNRSSSTASGSSGMFQGGPGGQMRGGNSLFGGSSGNGISAFYPVIAGGIILVAGIVLWTKRKWISAKLKKQ
jgi:archaellum component FlaF (FlaF/FlaG flagellin family)